MQSAQRGPAVLQFNAARKRDSQVQSLKTRLRKNMNAITENYELILSRAKVSQPHVMRTWYIQYFSGL